MNATVENTHTNILRRFDIIKESVDTITKLDLNDNAVDLIQMTQTEYDSLYDDYDKQSGCILLKYYESSENSIMYFSFINSENISTRLDQCINYVFECYEMIGEFEYLEQTKKRYDQTPVFEQPIKHIDYDICNCGRKMNTTLNSNEIICYPCGWIKLVYNDNNEDMIYGRRDDKNIKHGKYDPSRRCKFWIDRIQGRENAEIPTDCIDSVHACIIRDNLKNTDIILCLQIREYLKETGYTSYNDHVSLIRKQITGYTPPSLTDTELQLLYHIFNKVITVFDDIKPAKKYNSPYYPYLVGKILYSILQPGMRRRQILECIHMQSNTTLISNDRIMKIICTRVSEIKYTPTIKSEFTIYR